jgi:hypothetical protein
VVRDVRPLDGIAVSRAQARDELSSAASSAAPIGIVIGGAVTNEIVTVRTRPRTFV